MPKEILIATHNIHKKEEIQEILGEDYVVKSLTDYGINEEIVEDGSTFEENAKIKADYCYNKTGIPSVGDDSGLVVEALDGRPGIYSARYAESHNFFKNMAKVLDEMQSEDNRRAYFITVMCYVDENGPRYFEGRAYGNILEENRGVEGFGYDPIFVPDGYTKTFAEMTSDQKNAISHRKKAIQDFLVFQENS